MKDKNYISKITKERDKIVITPGEALTPFLNGDFFVKYESEFDISELGDEIAVIPFVLSTAPIVWCSGESLTIDKLDLNLFESLDELKGEYMKMYPTIKWSGQIKVNETVESKPSTGKDGILFSGGLDSIYTALKVPGDKYLFTINGADSKLNEEYPWKLMKEHTLDFALKHNFKKVFIYSNFKEFLNVIKLHSWHREITHWYSHVQFGPALLGLTAPIMFLNGGQKLYISSGGQIRSLVKGWGSSQILDQKVKFGEVTIHHFGDRTRLEKIQDIVELKRNGTVNDVILRTCAKYERGAEANCSVCEKCLRTAAMLIVEGENPKDWGFSLNELQTLKTLKSKLKKYKINTPPVFTVQWRIIQERAKMIEAKKELSEYIQWIIRFNFKRYYNLRFFFSGRKIYSGSPRIIRKQIRRLYFNFYKK